MKESLLELLSCPHCKSGELSANAEARDSQEIRTGQIVCPACGKSYGIKNGVCFIFDALSPEAEREIKATDNEEAASAQEGEWVLRYPEQFRTGIDDRAARMMKLSADNALRVLEGLKAEGKTILELGASTTWLTARLAEKNSCIALDIYEESPRGVGAADLFFKSRHIYYERVVADMIELPFKDGSLDLVIICAALHHSSDLDRTCREVRRILKPGGIFLAINEPCTGIFGRDREQVSADLETGWNENRYTLSQWKSHLAQTGFKVQASLPENFSDVIRSRGRFMELLALAWESLPSGLVRVANRFAAPIILAFFDGFANIESRKAH